MTAEMFDRLREQFPPEQVGKLPRITCRDCSQAQTRVCGKHAKSKCEVCDNWITGSHIHLDYVGHGAVTDRLLKVDPQWNWEPLASDERGLPLFDVDAKGNPVGLWIKLTVLGVTRLGFGSLESGKFDAEKQLIGDALRNAAMRFGVALDLWVKGHSEDDEKSAAADERQRPARASQKAAEAAPEDPRISRLKELNGRLTPDEKKAYREWRAEQDIPDMDRTHEQIEACITFLENGAGVPA